MRKNKPHKHKLLHFLVCHFQKRKMATKRVPRARIRVSTPELAIIFRGESVSGHPGALGGPKKSANRPDNFYFLEFSKSLCLCVLFFPKAPVPGHYSACSLAQLGRAIADVESCPGRGTQKPVSLGTENPPVCIVGSKILKTLDFF